MLPALLLVPCSFLLFQKQTSALAGKSTAVAPVLFFYCYDWQLIFTYIEC